MKTIKKYNNNVILADDDGQEVIVLGKGLGFDAIAGANVDANLVEKVFVPQETAEINRFAHIISDLPYEFILFSSKIVDYSRKELSLKLGQSIIIALADHFAFVVSRLKQGLDIEMPLLLDIQHIYPLEFKIGMYALGELKKEFGLDFPSAEAANIALHLVNAETEGSDMPGTMKIATIMKNTIKIIEEYYKLVFDENAFEFMGFLAHLRNGLLRYNNHKQKDTESDGELYRLIRKNYPDAFSCSEKVAAYYLKSYGWDFTQNDFSFLALHIKRIVDNTIDNAKGASK